MTFKQQSAALFAALASVAMSLAPAVIPILGLFLGLLANVPLIYIGLRDGRRALLYTLLFACLLLASGRSIPSLLIFLVLHGLPVLLIVHLGLQNKTGSQIVSVLTRFNILLLGAGTFILVITLGKDPTQWLTTLVPQLGLFLQNLSQAKLLPLIPGFILAFTTLTQLMNASVAVRLLQKKGRAPRDYPLPEEYEPTKHWDIVFCFGTLFALLPVPLLSFAGANLMTVSAVPLLFVGLRIFYVWFLQFKVEKTWFFVLLFMMIILVWPLMFVVAIGLFEPVLKFYPRLKNLKD